MSLAWDQDTAVALPHGGLIAGITHLVGLQLDQSEAPAFEFSQVVLMTQGSNSDQIAQVRQWAAAMDVTAEWIEEHTVRASGWLGPLNVLVYTHLKSDPEVATFLCSAVDEVPAAEADTELLQLVDESAMPEVTCGACLASGKGPLGGSCIYCLGKCRILAWQPRHAAGAPAW